MGLFDAFTGQPVIDAANRAAGAATSGYNAGYGAYAPLAEAGRTALTSNYGTGISQLFPYQTAGTQALGSYADALGLNGAAGTARAKSAFQASPGYQYTLDQGINAIKRNAGTTGLLASGNTLQSIGRYTQNLADQDYNNYLARLFGLTTAGQSAAGNAAGLYANLGGGLAGSYTGQGQQVYNTNVGIGNAQAAADIAAGNAQMQGNANLWGALLNAGNAGVKLAGYLPSPSSGVKLGTGGLY